MNRTEFLAWQTQHAYAIRPNHSGKFGPDSPSPRKSGKCQPNSGLTALAVLDSMVPCVFSQDEFTNHKRMETKLRRTPNQLNAEAAYKSAHLVAQNMVTRIGELLFELLASGKDQLSIHWGHVGDLNEINSRLSAVIAFMTPPVSFGTRNRLKLVRHARRVGP
jgi:hypothetical protein